MNQVNINNNRGYEKFIYKTDNNVSIFDKQNSNFCRCHK